MAKKRVVASAKTTHLEKQNPAASIPVPETSMNTILFDPSLDIAGAAQLQQQLNGVLLSKTPVALDAANVERVDTAALQVLTAFFKDAEAANLTVQWQHASEALTNAARLLGLGPSLHLDQA